MSTKYNTLVFIGRFQPFHLGHKQVVIDALEQADHVLILVGSAFQPRTIKNPFTYGERYEMILSSLDPQHISRVTIRPLRDYLYNDAQWIAQVQQIVNVTTVPGEKIGIVGYEKDSSSWYLKEFPQWDYLEVSYNDKIDATSIRGLWILGQSAKYATGVLTEAVHKFMFTTFAKNNREELARLNREFLMIENYKKQWAGSPYVPQFITTDAVVIQSGHILLVQRKAAPGEGLWALPGGFVNANETINNAMIRELREETGIKVPEPVLRGSTKSSRVFDAPGRSLRGRTVTHAYLIELAAGPLPKVKGSDDAAKAKWFTFAEFEKMEEVMFEDHFHIPGYFLGRV